MPFSASPGSTVAFTLTLPQAATTTVQWTVTDPGGNVVAEGAQPATGTLVAVGFVMPSSAMVPLDGTPYLVTATDGTTSASDSIAIISALDPGNAYAGEIAYVAGKPFIDVLVTDAPVTDVTVTVSMMDGTVLGTATVDPSTATRYGNGYAYRVNMGVINTSTLTTYGVGTCTWDFLPQGALTSDQQMHAFWTITPYSGTMLAAIKKLVDRAHAGDANRYLNVTTTDLANALIRGIDYVIESPPMSTPFALDQTPISLRDYVIKAGAVDFLRAQYLAEGMSAFDFQGEGVQLNVDRSQYIDGLAQQLNSDLQGLPLAKKAWQQQGMPLGAAIVPGVRPVGILALTVGTYSNWKASPAQMGFGLGGYSFLRGPGGLPLSFW